MKHMKNARNAGMQILFRRHAAIARQMELHVMAYVWEVVVIIIRKNVSHAETYCRIVKTLNVKAKQNA